MAGAGPSLGAGQRPMLTPEAGIALQMEILGMKQEALHQVWLEESHASYFKYHPPWRGLESKEDEEALLDFDLEAPLEL